ncbi:MAG: FecR domain-containing protein [Rudaea sp.]|uniref:FecR family protein n=1 Tax=unclassified Rudaea TaxID=2627037 RepID=UPI0010F4AFB7|nr:MULTISPECIES: FecR domain-containing protein [unclassified Rudaea]MBN8888394.1 FecR domain-containing protein [Rudaea sp.]MBR0345842.1 FecR domain-containing protein [Rudaea sp.]
MDKDKREPGIDPNLQTAADWWTRLRDRRKAARVEEAWLEWTGADTRRLDAFARVDELGAQLGALDAETKRDFVREFAPASARTARWLPFALAASFVLATVAAGVLFWNHQRASAVETGNYATTIAVDRNVALSDGSQIALGGATRLTTHFARDRRDVDLSAGEAFFQVAHDTSRPFVVNAGEVSIRAVGTAFNVRRTGDRVAITVSEGRVRIASSEGQANGRQSAAEAVEAVAGQQISFDPRASGLTVSTISAGHAVGWREHRLEFVNEPLDSVVANINRYSTRPLTLADTKLGALAFTGTVDTTALDSWLEALPKILPLRVAADGERVTLSAANRDTR